MTEVKSDDKTLKPLEESLLEVLILNPDKVIYEGQATKVFAPGPYGDVAFLPHHAPLYSELRSGTVIIEEKDGKKINKKIDGGVVRTKSNSIKILVGF